MVSYRVLLCGYLRDPVVSSALVIKSVILKKY